MSDKSGDKNKDIRDGEVMTIEEAADFLRLNYYTVYRMVRSGEIPASRVRRVWRISKKDILKYLERQKKRK